MHYTVAFTWISEKTCPFDHVPNAALHRYEELQRESLFTPGCALPVTKPGDWSCHITFEDTNEHVYHATFFSTLPLDEFRRLMESRLIPGFADRLQVEVAKPSERAAVLEN